MMKAFIFRKPVTVFACVIVLAGRVSADLVNGGFESDFSGWLASGNVTVKSTPPYLATEGAKLAVFNSVNSVPGGFLETATDFIPGHRYRIEFDAGNLSYNSLHQRIEVKIEDNVSIPPPPGALPPYLVETIDITGPGGGATAWVAASYEFIPAHISTRITFTDVSTVTNSLDLVLDHIRVTDISPATGQMDNGGFESDFSGWSASGNVSIQSNPPYRPTEGRKLAAFNAANSTPNGSLGRSIAVDPGQSYRLQFDVGNLAYNSGHQRLQVRGTYGLSYHFSGTVVDDIIDIPGPGGGATAWVAASYDFIGPLNGFVNLSFTDVSQVTNSLDLVLDRVRLTKLDSAAPLVNGGFESGLDGWNPGGNVATYSTAPYKATEGTKLAAFNSGNSAPTGSIGQGVAVTPGKRYRLVFDVGNLSYNSQHQRLQVWLFYNTAMLITTLVSETIDIPGPGGGATAWVAASYEFTGPANGFVSLRFTDVSQATNSLDLVLDNIRIVAVP